jgi:hypothetical protein
MSNPPDSILEAARKLARALQVPWPDLQKTYRKLQEQDPGNFLTWIPKSEGRQIWYAHPNFITRLIVAHAMSGDKISCSDAVLITHGLTADGVDFQPGYPAANHEAPLEEIFASYLCHPDRAAKLKRIELSSFDKTVAFVEDERTVECLRKPCRGIEREDASEFGKALKSVLDGDTFERLSKIAIIDGSVIQELSEQVSWRFGNFPPFEHGKADVEMNE